MAEMQPQAGEIDRWAVWRNHKRCEGVDCDHPYHLLATLDRQAEQIERLQFAAAAGDHYAGQLADADRKLLDQAEQIERLQRAARAVIDDPLLGNATASVRALGAALEAGR